MSESGGLLRKLPPPEQHFDAHTAQAHVSALKLKAEAIHLPWDTIVSLIVQFGPKIVPLLMDVMNAFQGGFDWKKVTGLLATDGPLVMALIEQIAAALGVTLPTMPPMQSQATT